MLQSVRNPLQLCESFLGVDKSRLIFRRCCQISIEDERLPGASDQFMLLSHAVDKFNLHFQSAKNDWPKVFRCPCGFEHMGDYLLGEFFCLGLIRTVLEIECRYFRFKESVFLNFNVKG